MLRNFCDKLTNHNYRVLWAEAVVLSVIIGIGLASWPGVIILLAAFTTVTATFFGVIARSEATKQSLYIVFLIGLFSCAWGFLAGMVGFGLGGWAWALLLGILALISGIKIHCRDLTRLENIEQFYSKKWRQKWRLGPQNLN